MHCLIVGMTESGKSTLGKILCGGLKKSGKATAVLDPWIDPEWDCDFITDDATQFMRYIVEHRKAFLFIDEGSETVGRYNKQTAFLANQSRHMGMACYFILQGATQVDPTLRGNCSDVFLFACATPIFEKISVEWNKPQLLKIAPLDRGEFLHIPRFGEIRRYRLTPGKPKKGIQLVTE